MSAHESIHVTADRQHTKYGPAAGDVGIGEDSGAWLFFVFFLLLAAGLKSMKESMAKRQTYLQVEVVDYDPSPVLFVVCFDDASVCMFYLKAESTRGPQDCSSVRTMMSLHTKT